jgi:hypothetical protein
VVCSAFQQNEISSFLTNQAIASWPRNLRLLSSIGVAPVKQRLARNALGIWRNQSLFDFAHRAAAACRAISLRRLLLSFSARARPPTFPASLPIAAASSLDKLLARAFPPRLAISLRRSGDSFLTLSFASATAAGFFFMVTVAYYTVPWV